MPELQGAADVLMVADPSTFRVLPWAPDTGWFLCDLKLQDGRPVPYCTRSLLKDALQKSPYEMICGLEVEFHVFRITDENLQPSDAGQPGNPPSVELLTTGYQYLTEQRYDQIDPVVQILRSNLEATRSCRCAPSRWNSGRASSSSPSRRCPRSPRPTP